MQTRLFGPSSLLALSLALSGCQSLFPRDSVRARDGWESFEEAQAVYDRIIPHETSVAALQEMGVDALRTPNIRILTYLDLIQRFLPNSSLTREDLHPDVRHCLEQMDRCVAWELTLAVENRRRYGSLFLDIFGFKRLTKVTGWSFQALVILDDGVVTYKLRSGTPLLDRVEKRLRPLGPLQEFDSILYRLPGML